MPCVLGVCLSPVFVFSNNPRVDRVGVGILGLAFFIRPMMDQAIVFIHHNNSRLYRYLMNGFLYAPMM